jgi:hypothetical protein
LTTLGATSGGTVDAMRQDLGKLAAAVAAVAGEQIAFVAHPATSLKLRLMAGDQFSYPIYSSGQIAQTTIICVGLNVLASAVGSNMRIDVARDTTLHMETAPTQGLVEGGAFQAGANVRSLWQTDAVGIKIVLNVSWGLRDPAGAAFISNLTW